MTQEQQVQKIEYWYKELYRLMWAMVWDIANSDRFYLHPDDVFAELSEELVKIVRHYCDKPNGELKSLLIVSLRHRCADLQIMEYHTHRNVGLDSLDADIDGVTLLDTLPGVDFDAMHFDLSSFYDELSEDGCVLVQEVLEPSDQLLMQMKLAVMRKVAVSKKGLWKLGPTKNIYRRALGWPKERFDEAWQEISEVLAEW